MLAAGVGLTTMRGLAEEIAGEAPTCGPGGLSRPSVVVMHRIRSHSDALFEAEFAAAAHTADVSLIRLIGSRSDRSGWWGGSRSIDPTVALSRIVPDLGHREVYLCGPADWMREVRASLKTLGVRPDRIHAEEFGW